MSVRPLHRSWSIGAHYSPSLVSVFSHMYTDTISVGATTTSTPPPNPFYHNLYQNHTTPWIQHRSPSTYQFPPTARPFYHSTTQPVLLSRHPSPALPLTIKKYLCNFKWHLSAAQRKRKWGKEKSSEGVFSSLLFSHPSCCQSLKSVSLTFFFLPLHIFHFLWVISWYTFWQPNQN